MNIPSPGPFARASVAAVLLCAAPLAGEPAPRRAFPIPLVVLTTALDASGNCTEVFAGFEGSREGLAVGPVNDRYARDTPRERLDIDEIEAAGQTHLVSQFEAKVLAIAVGSLEKGLDVFERDLKNGSWDRLHYYDTFLSLFLHGFRHMLVAAKRDPGLFSPAARIDTALVASTFTAPVTDRRIAAWRATPDHVLKLRIAAKELAYQAKLWRKNELENPKRDPWDDGSKKFRAAYELFVRLYFNLLQAGAPRSAP